MLLMQSQDAVVGLRDLRPQADQVSNANIDFIYPVCDLPVSGTRKVEIGVFGEMRNHVSKCHVRASGQRFNVEKRIHIDAGYHRQAASATYSPSRDSVLSPHRG